uniref:Retrovirus-related Pol polyprotein from transposon TNT 1-94-like beta-barrel domain-containing protein n=1 Tax=Cannabis sativa TaxID=3483 RepID=A0A803NLU9_CANSA
MADYLKMKRMWADSLALAGEPYPERHLISNILSGLDAEYLSIVVLIESQANTTWKQLQKTWIEWSSNTGGQRRFNTGRNHGRGQQNTGYTRGGRYRGRGQGGRSTGPKPTCQVCGKYGHWSHDESYMGNQPNTAGNQDKHLSALVATPEMLNDDSWYADSGASKHLTADANKLQTKTEYEGKELITIGDGSQLPISHIGTGIFKPRVLVSQAASSPPTPGVPLTVQEALHHEGWNSAMNTEMAALRRNRTWFVHESHADLLFELMHLLQNDHSGGSWLAWSFRLAYGVFDLEGLVYRRTHGLGFQRSTKDSWVGFST